MEENYVGKTLQNDKDEEFVVLSQVCYKNLLCVYAMKSLPNDAEGDKAFFQVSGSKKKRLVPINSPKMTKALYDMMFKNNAKEAKPRKIKEDESITEYFNYLD